MGGRATSINLTADLQTKTLRLFTELCRAGKCCKHRFALCFGGSEVFAAALAVIGLGGASLLLDSDTDVLRAADRVGATDFTVTDLTEALRILKTELRKGTPIGVGLTGAPLMLLEAMRERGVQPDVLCFTEEHRFALQPFQRPETMLLALAPEGTSKDGHSIRMDVAETLMERRPRDRQLHQELTTASCSDVFLRSINAEWLTAAPRLFPRDRHRSYWGAE